MLPTTKRFPLIAALIGTICLTLASCSEADPLEDLAGEWRLRCGGIAPTGLRITEQGGERYFTIIGNTPAPVERVTEDGDTLTVIAGDSRVTITKLSTANIKAFYYGREYQLERCN